VELPEPGIRASLVEWAEHQGGLLLQRLHFAGEAHDAGEIDRGADPKIRDQERTLAERLISELSGTESQSSNYEDEYRKRLLKAIEQKVAGLEIQRVEVHVERRINEKEAAVIREIFEKAAAGWGTRRIAHDLNARDVLAPPPRRAGRPRAWAPSTIYAMLTGSLYRGEISWNRTAASLRSHSPAAPGRRPR
jgi:hypothetical protein